MSGSRARKVVAVSLACALGACAWQPRDATVYAAKAVEASEHVRSVTQTAVVVVSAAARGSIAFATAVVMMREAETDAGSAGDTFARFQPPDEASMEIRDAVVRALEGAASAIADARVALLSRRPDDLHRAAPRLQRWASVLALMAERHR